MASYEVAKQLKKAYDASSLDLKNAKMMCMDTEQ